MASTVQTPVVVGLVPTVVTPPLDVSVCQVGRESLVTTPLTNARTLRIFAVTMIKFARTSLVPLLALAGPVYN